MKKATLWVKTIAVIMVVIFSYTSIALSSPDVYRIKVPEKYGKVTSRYKASSTHSPLSKVVPDKAGDVNDNGNNNEIVYNPLAPFNKGEFEYQRQSAQNNRTVILVQDAHAIFSAQKNIARIINALLLQIGNADNRQQTKDQSAEIEKSLQSTVSSLQSVPFIGIEGAIGSYDFKELREFPLQEPKERVVQEYVKKGVFTGSELAHITGKNDFELYGCEQQDAFVANFKPFFQLNAKQTELERELAFLEEQVRECKHRILNKELADFDSEAAQYENGKKDMLSYLGFLSSYIDTLRIDLLAYPTLQQFQEVYVMQLNISKDALKKELEALVEVLCEEKGEGRSKKEDGTQLNVGEQHDAPGRTDQNNQSSITNARAYWNQYTSGKISEKEIVFALTGLAAQQKISLSGYLNIPRSHQYWNTYGALHMEELIQEVFLLTNVIRHTLAQSAQEKELIDIGNRIIVLKRLISLSAVRSDVESFRRERDVYTGSSIRTALHALDRDEGETSSMINEEILKLVDDYYRAADTRDAVLIDTLLHAMDEKQQDIGVLVAGGYHTQGMAQILAKRGVSYLVVTPAIDAVKDDIAYRDRMTGELATLNPLLISSFQPNRFAMVLSAAAEDSEVKRIVNEALCHIYGSLLVDLDSGLLSDGEKMRGFIAELKKSQQPRVKVLADSLEQIYFKEGLEQQTIISGVSEAADQKTLGQNLRAEEPLTAALYSYEELMAMLHDKESSSVVEKTKQELLADVQENGRIVQNALRDIGFTKEVVVQLIHAIFDRDEVRIHDILKSLHDQALTYYAKKDEVSTRTLNDIADERSRDLLDANKITFSNKEKSFNAYLQLFTNYGKWVSSIYMHEAIEPYLMRSVILPQDDQHVQAEYASYGFVDRLNKIVTEMIGSFLIVDCQESEADRVQRYQQTLLRAVQWYYLFLDVVQKPEFFIHNPDFLSVIMVKDTTTGKERAISESEGAPGRLYEFLLSCGDIIAADDKNKETLRHNHVGLSTDEGRIRIHALGGHPDQRCIDEVYALAADVRTELDLYGVQGLCNTRNGLLWIKLAKLYGANRVQFKVNLNAQEGHHWYVLLDNVIVVDIVPLTGVEYSQTDAASTSSTMIKGLLQAIPRDFRSIYLSEEGDRNLRAKYPRVYDFRKAEKDDVYEFCRSIMQIRDELEKGSQHVQSSAVLTNRTTIDQNQNRMVRNVIDLIRYMDPYDSRTLSYAIDGLKEGTESAEEYYDALCEIVSYQQTHPDVRAELAQKIVTYFNTIGALIEKGEMSQQRYQAIGTVIFEVCGLTKEHAVLLLDEMKNLKPDRYETIDRFLAEQPLVGGYALMNTYKEHTEMLVHIFENNALDIRLRIYARMLYFETTQHVLPYAEDFYEKIRDFFYELAEDNDHTDSISSYIEEKMLQSPFGEIELQVLNVGILMVMETMFSQEIPASQRPVLMKQSMESSIERSYCDANEQHLYGASVLRGGGVPGLIFFVVHEIGHNVLRGYRYSPDTIEHKAAHEYIADCMAIAVMQNIGIRRNSFYMQKIKLFWDEYMFEKPRVITSAHKAARIHIAALIKNLEYVKNDEVLRRMWRSVVMNAYELLRLNMPEKDHFSRCVLWSQKSLILQGSVPEFSLQETDGRTTGMPQQGIGEQSDAFFDDVRRIVDGAIGYSHARMRETWDLGAAQERIVRIKNGQEHVTFVIDNRAMEIDEDELSIMISFFQHMNIMPRVLKPGENLVQFPLPQEYYCITSVQDKEESVRKSAKVVTVLPEADSALRSVGLLKFDLIVSLMLCATVQVVEWQSVFQNLSRWIEKESNKDLLNRTIAVLKQRVFKTAA